MMCDPETLRLSAKARYFALELAMPAAQQHRLSSATRATKSYVTYVNCSGGIAGPCKDTCTNDGGSDVTKTTGGSYAAPFSLTKRTDEEPKLRVGELC